jgi:hypothetical protein
MDEFIRRLEYLIYSHDSLIDHIPELIDLLDTKIAGAVYKKSSGVIIMSTYDVFVYLNLITDTKGNYSAMFLQVMIGDEFISYTYRNSTILGMLNRYYENHNVISRDTWEYFELDTISKNNIRNQFLTNPHSTISTANLNVAATEKPKKIFRQIPSKSARQ